jgi:hypothetical protein
MIVSVGNTAIVNHLMYEARQHPCPEEGRHKPSEGGLILVLRETYEWQKPGGRPLMAKYMRDQLGADE